MNCKVLFLSFLGFFILEACFGQSFVNGVNDTLPKNTEVQIFKISIDDILNQPIVLASKKTEKIINSPLSATVITSDEIIKAGCTSIPEALRLSPGLLVKEQSNGNYEVYIRGLDNVPFSGDDPTFSANTIILVMINNRPVYDYFQGGTFWETLPVALADIIKIEIVRGASSALYGANAVQGVINIITRDDVVPAVSTIKGVVHFGNNNSFIGSLKVDQKIKKASIGISLNHHREDRDFTNYYAYRKDDYIQRDSIKFLSSKASDRYPDSTLGLNRSAANFYFSYSPTSKISFHTIAGLHESKSQKIYVDNQTTPFTTNYSDSRYIQCNLNIHNLYSQFSYNVGHQNAVGLSGWEYNYNNIDAQVEYAFLRKNLVVRPGASFRLSEYNDQKIINQKGTKYSLINGRRQIRSFALYVRSEYEKGIIRIISAIRGEQFNIPNKTYISYQFASTITPSKKIIFRLVHSRANRSSFILDSYYNQKFSYGPITVALEGNRNLLLMQMDLYEVGFRAKIGKSIFFDTEFFLNQSKNYSKLIAIEDNDPTYELSRFENLALKAQQYGSTISLDYIPSSRWKIKAYATYQETIVKNSLNLLGEDTTYKHLGTPAWYGGLVSSIRFLKHFNFNINPYFFTGYTIRTAKLAKELSVKNNVLINAKLDYTIGTKTSLFVTVRNLFSQNYTQVTWADPIGAKYLMGITIDF